MSTTTSLPAAPLAEPVTIPLTAAAVIDGGIGTMVDAIVVPTCLPSCSLTE